MKEDTRETAAKIALLVVMISVLAVTFFVLSACGDAAPRYLSGKLAITPNTNVEVGTELTASYSGSETVDYQWQRGKTNVGTNSNKYTPTEAGSYTVTVSAAGYVSLTSSPVVVGDEGEGECAHNYQWVETTPATLSNANPPVATDGVETGTCSICGSTTTRPVTYQSYFYGTWDGYRENATTNTYIMELSADKIKITRTDTAGNWFQIDDLIWTPGKNPKLESVSNPTSEPTIEVGYILTGTWDQTSVGFDDLPKFVGFSPDKTKLLANMNASSLTGVEHIYTKQ